MSPESAGVSQVHISEGKKGGEGRKKEGGGKGGEAP